ncbi:MAG: hypothetical protein IT307_02910 [Chloroflexi bacterium]|nr:hypothetical protein [Chloroflexota bacterium]
MWRLDGWLLLRGGLALGLIAGMLVLMALPSGAQQSPAAVRTPTATAASRPLGVTGPAGPQAGSAGASTTLTGAGVPLGTTGAGGPFGAGSTGAGAVGPGASAAMDDPVQIHGTIVGLDTISRPMMAQLRTPTGDHMVQFTDTSMLTGLGLNVEATFGGVWLAPGLLSARTVVIADMTPLAFGAATPTPDPFGAGTTTGLLGQATSTPVYDDNYYADDNYYSDDNYSYDDNYDYVYDDNYLDDNGETIAEDETPTATPTVMETATAGPTSTPTATATAVLAATRTPTRTPGGKLTGRERHGSRSRSATDVC